MRRFATAFFLIASFALLASNNVAQAVNMDADIKCSPVKKECGCGQLKNKKTGKCEKGENEYMCSCKDLTNGKLTTGICVEEFKCLAQSTDGETPQQATQQQKDAWKQNQQPPSGGDGPNGGAEDPQPQAKPSGAPSGGDGPSGGAESPQPNQSTETQGDGGNVEPQPNAQPNKFDDAFNTAQQGAQQPWSFLKNPDAFLNPSMENAGQGSSFNWGNQSSLSPATPPDAGADSGAMGSPGSGGSGSGDATGFQNAFADKQDLQYPDSGSDAGQQQKQGWGEWLSEKWSDFQNWLTPTSPETPTTPMEATINERGALEMSRDQNVFSKGEWDEYVKSDAFAEDAKTRLNTDSIVIAKNGDSVEVYNGRDYGLDAGKVTATFDGMSDTRYALNEAFNGAPPLNESVTNALESKGSEISQNIMSSTNANGDSIGEKLGEFAAASAAKTGLVESIVDGIGRPYSGVTVSGEMQFGNGDQALSYNVNSQVVVPYEGVTAPADVTPPTETPVQAEIVQQMEPQTPPQPTPDYSAQEVAAPQQSQPEASTQQQADAGGQSQGGAQNESTQSGPSESQQQSQESSQQSRQSPQEQQQQYQQQEQSQSQEQSAAQKVVEAAQSVAQAVANTVQAATEAVSNALAETAKQVEVAFGGAESASPSGETSGGAQANAQQIDSGGSPSGAEPNEMEDVSQPTPQRTASNESGSGAQPAPNAQSDTSGGESAPRGSEGGAQGEEGNREEQQTQKPESRLQGEGNQEQKEGDQPQQTAEDGSGSGECPPAKPGEKAPPCAVGSEGAGSSEKENPVMKAAKAVASALGKALEELLGIKPAEAKYLVDGKQITAYGPGAGGTMQGGFETSRKNLEGEYVPRTLEDVAAGRSNYVTLATAPENYGKFYDLGNVTFKDSNGVTHQLENVVGYAHDTGNAFRAGTCGDYGTCNIRLNKLDIAAGDYRGWSGSQAASYITRNMPQIETADVMSRSDAMTQIRGGSYETVPYPTPRPAASETPTIETAIGQGSYAASPSSLLQPEFTPNETFSYRNMGAELFGPASPLAQQGFTYEAYEIAGAAPAGDLDYANAANPDLPADRASDAIAQADTHDESSQPGAQLPPGQTQTPHVPVAAPPGDLDYANQPNSNIPNTSIEQISATDKPMPNEARAPAAQNPFPPLLNVPPHDLDFASARNPNIPDTTAEHISRTDQPMPNTLADASPFPPLLNVPSNDLDYPTERNPSIQDRTGDAIAASEGVGAPTTPVERGGRLAEVIQPVPPTTPVQDGGRLDEAINPIPPTVPVERGGNLDEAIHGIPPTVPVERAGSLGEAIQAIPPTTPVENGGRLDEAVHPVPPTTPVERGPDLKPAAEYPENEPFVESGEKITQRITNENETDSSRYEPDRSEPKKESVFSKIAGWFKNTFGSGGGTGGSLSDGPETTEGAGSGNAPRGDGSASRGDPGERSGEEITQQVRDVAGKSAAESRAKLEAQIAMRARELGLDPKEPVTYKPDAVPYERASRAEIAANQAKLFGEQIRDLQNQLDAMNVDPTHSESEARRSIELKQEIATLQEKFGQATETLIQDTLYDSNNKPVRDLTYEQAAARKDFIGERILRQAMGDDYAEKVRNPDEVAKLGPMLRSDAEQYVKADDRMKEIEAGRAAQPQESPTNNQSNLLARAISGIKDFFGKLGDWSSIDPPLRDDGTTAATDTKPPENEIPAPEAFERSGDEITKQIRDQAVEEETQSGKDLTKQIQDQVERERSQAEPRTRSLSPRPPDPTQPSPPSPPVSPNPPPTPPSPTPPPPAPAPPAPAPPPYPQPRPPQPTAPESDQTPPQPQPQPQLPPPRTPSVPTETPKPSPGRNVEGSGGGLSSIMGMLSGILQALMKALTGSQSQPPTPPQPQPLPNNSRMIYVNSKAMPNPTYKGSSTEVSWTSINASSCYVVSPSGTRLAYGTPDTRVLISSVTATSTYVVWCMNGRGAIASSSVTVGIK